MNKISEKLNIIKTSKDDIKIAIETDGIEVGSVGIQEYADKINIMNTNIANAYTAIEEKGVITTNAKNSDNLASTISAIQTGGTGSSAIEKGIIVHECNTSGYATKVETVGMTSIPGYYFGNNNSTYNNALNRSLQEVILNPEVTSIQANAFTYTRVLMKINLPDGITSIGTEGFKQCINLALDKLPNSLKGMGQNCFANCSKLAIKEIPEGVTELLNSTFALCTSLTEITIKGNITKLNYGVFNGCSSLVKLVIPNITAVPTLLSTDAFTSTPLMSKTGAIYVPDNLVDSMKSASNWSYFGDIIKPLSELEG